MNEICQEVRRFLKELGRELPGIFSCRPPAPRFAAPPVITASPPRPPGEINRKQAGELIRARVKCLGAALGLEYGKVFIKDQRTLWASCSRSKNLNFNWRLAAAPAEILDYVVMHELCHLREMNHSKRFWGLVREVCPDYKARKKWLKDNGMALRAPQLPAAPAQVTGLS